MYTLWSFFKIIYNNKCKQTGEVGNKESTMWHHREAEIHSRGSQEEL